MLKSKMKKTRTKEGSLEVSGRVGAWLLLRGETCRGLQGEMEPWLALVLGGEVAMPGRESNRFPPLSHCTNGLVCQVTSNSHLFASHSQRRN